MTVNIIRLLAFKKLFIKEILFLFGSLSFMRDIKPDRKELDEQIKVTDQIIKETSTILNSVQQLQEEIFNLQRVKSQYQIYFQFFNNDRILLQNLYQTMKQRLEKETPKEDEEFVTPKQSLSTIQPQSEISVQPIQLNASGRQLPYTLYLTSINWEIDVQNNFFTKKHIRSRYVLNANVIVVTIAFNITGDRFAFADGRTIFLVHSEDGSLLHTFQIPQTLDQKELQTRALKFSPDSQFLVCNGFDHLIYVYIIETGEFYTVLNGHTDVVSSILFSKDSKKLISAGFDGKIIIWDLYQKQIIKEINHAPPNPIPNEQVRNKDAIIIGMEYGFDESFVIVGFMNGNVGIYDQNFQQNMNVFSAHQMPLLGISCSPKSELVATASQDNTLKVWSLRGIATRKQTLIGHTNYVITSAFSLNDKFLFSGSKDESIKLWDISTGEIECTINAHQNTVFKIDHHPSRNSFVTCGGDGLICFWDYDLP